MRKKIALGALVAIAGLAGAAGTGEAAVYELAGPQVVTITKDGGTFSWSKIAIMSQALSAEIANYNRISFDVTASSGPNWTADGNVGLVWNADGAGFHNNISIEWYWANRSGTITYDYSGNAAFKNAFAAHASGAAGWAEFGMDSNWPAFTGSNQYQVNSVYLSDPIPEPTALAGLAGLALLALRRR
jgi:hypothetical protein